MLMSRRAGRLASFVLAVCLASGGGPRAMAAPDVVTVSTFPGAANWPIWVAQSRGFFERENIRVDLSLTPNSVEQMTGLIDGRYDIAETALDNVVAYVEGQGAATQRPPDIVAFMGGDNGFLRLVAAADVAGVAGLKGKRVAVDAPTTGYAFVLRRMLELNGVDWSDVTVISTGGTPSRLQALVERRADATLLNTPFEFLAEERGLRRLGNAADALSAYQGVVGAARRETLSTRRAMLEGYVRAYRGALQWLYAPENKADALALLRREQPAIGEALAAELYNAFLNPGSGFQPRAEIDAAGARQVLELRSRYGRPEKALSDPTRYVSQIDPR